MFNVNENVNENLTNLSTHQLNQSTRQLLKALKLPLQGEGGERGPSSTYKNNHLLMLICFAVLINIRNKKELII